MNSTITYEQPLNERVRNFLRAEYLFDQLEHFIINQSEWGSRQTLSILFDIIDFLTRSDLKTELIKELERYSNTLKTLENSRSVDLQRLVSVLGEINVHLISLRDNSYQPGQSLRQNDFITNIKQRNYIPGGSCSFDLPSFYCWLNNPFAKRYKQLREWQEDLQLINKSTKLSLQMIRNSTDPYSEQAENGFYQKPIEANASCQLVRVALLEGSKYYPEISGGKHRFAIRFMEQATVSDKPIQTHDNVKFDLHCCIL